MQLHFGKAEKGSDAFAAIAPVRLGSATENQDVGKLAVMRARPTLSFLAGLLVALLQLQ